jgi:hypothetical protein
MHRPITIAGLIFGSLGAVAIIWAQQHNFPSAGTSVAGKKAPMHSVATIRRLNASTSDISRHEGRLPFSLMLPTNPEEAITRGLQWLADEREADDRDEIERQLLARLTEENAPRILASLPREFGETPVALAALEKWPRRDPPAALQWLATLSEPSRVQIETVLRGWFDESPEKIPSYLAGLSPGPWKEHVLEAASFSALRKNRPQDAVTWLMQLPSEKRRDELVEGAVAVWARADVVSAVSWASEQSEPGFQDRLLAGVAVGYASRDPSAAMDFARGIFKSGEAVDRVIAGIVTAWAEKDLPAAAAGVAALPADDLRARAMEALLEAWVDYDPAEAQRWVLTQSSVERVQLSARLAFFTSRNRLTPTLALAGEPAVLP